MARISYPDWVYKMIVERRLPILNSAIIYMKTNVEDPACEDSPSSGGPERKLSVRLSRRRTHSSVVDDKGGPPIELSQVCGLICISYSELVQV